MLKETDRQRLIRKCYDLRQEADSITSETQGLKTQNAAMELQINKLLHRQTSLATAITVTLEELEALDPVPNPGQTKPRTPPSGTKT